MKMREQTERMLPRLRDIRDMVEVLVSDLNVVLDELVTSGGNPLRRRLLIRTLFALVEGFLSGMASYLLDVHRVGRWELSDEEVAICEDLSPPAGPRGDRKSRADLVERMKVVFKAAHRVFGDPYRADFSTVDFRKFRETIGVRDRLMHPKTPAHLQVSDEELASADRARAWFKEASTLFFDGAIAYAAKELREHQIRDHQ